VNEAALKAELPRTWGAFFSQHGRFTAAQSATIPLVLRGEHVMLCAATASGKTAAALAPLIERHLPPLRPQAQLRILYLLPTRALVSDLRERLDAPLARLRVTCAAKTRDFSTFNVRQPADLLLTTPESLDSLLASDARIFNQVRAVVIDELHAFDGTPRGDQLRMLLNRLRQVRDYAFRQGDADDATLQCAALSATALRPDAMAARYFSPAQVVQIAGSRAIEAMLVPLDPDDPTALVDYLSSFRVKGWRKGIIFCNTRAEVEVYAAVTRRSTPLFGDSIYVHYSNLEPEKRHETEIAFAQAEVGLCFASSTLELGIDIGSIDVALLVGAPGNAAAFHQRVGRAARRQSRVATVCFYRTPLERVLFDAFLQQTIETEHVYAFHLSVVIQQVFSLLKQSPLASVRIATLNALMANIVPTDYIERMLGMLQAQGYLQPGRAGEWRAGAALNRLFDLQASEHAPFSLYSNIQNSSGGQIAIREQGSQRVLANVDRGWFDREALTLEGRAMEVRWSDGESVWVTQASNAEATSRLSFRSARQLMSFETAQAAARHLGIVPNRTQVVQQGNRWLWFHWMGDLYGHVLLALLCETTCAALRRDPVGLCIEVTELLTQPPMWTEAQVKQHLSARYRHYEGMMALGAYHNLLPPELKRKSVMDHFAIDRFLRTTARWSIEVVTDDLAARLASLIEAE
jgi:ATP-dependent helicase Lhr and Lhr-like helicase